MQFNNMKNNLCKLINLLIINNNLNCKCNNNLCQYKMMLHQHSVIVMNQNTLNKNKKKS